jgi:hypothetical protein
MFLQRNCIFIKRGYRLAWTCMALRG